MLTRATGHGKINSNTQEFSVNSFNFLSETCLVSTLSCWFFNLSLTVNCVFYSFILNFHAAG